MIKPHIILLALMVCLTASAQSIHLPTAVDSTFATKYPNATMAVWKTKYSGYEVEYKIGESLMKSGFTAKGDWLKTETKISIKQLPAVVVDSFKLCRFAKITVKDVIKIEQQNKPLQFTIITMKGELNKTSLLFSEDGHLLSEKNFL